MNLNINEIYKDYDERVIRYMEFVIKQIEQDYSIVPSSWRVSLDLIADNLMIYFKALDDIKQNGVITYNRNGVATKNPSCNTQNAASQNVIKLLNNFALTPMSKSKMKNLDADDYENVLGNLLSND